MGRFVPTLGIAAYSYTQIEPSPMPSLTLPAWHTFSSVDQESMPSPLPMIKEEAHHSGCKMFSLEPQDKTISTQLSVLCMTCDRAPSLLSSLPTKRTVYQAKLLDTVPMTNPSGMSQNGLADESSTCDSAMHPLTHHSTPTMTSINAILKDVGFKNATHKKNIYTGQFCGEKALLVRQVDDFALGCCQ